MVALIFPATAAADSWMVGECGAGIASAEGTFVDVTSDDGSYSRSFETNEKIFDDGDLKPGTYTAQWNTGDADVFEIERCPAPDATPDPDAGDPDGVDVPDDPPVVEPDPDPTPEPTLEPEPPVEVVVDFSRGLRFYL